MRKAACLTTMLLMCATLAGARMVRDCRVAGTPGITSLAPGATPMRLTVDSIDFRPDLTRAYLKIAGRPNTSQRIDAVTLTMGKRALAATDIDPIELKHYFQFEESGSITLEIDFPAMAPSDRGSITFVTAHGTFTYTLR